MLSAKEEKILDAALRVFLKFGFRRVTMNEIAEEAGISRPGLYLAYNSTEQVFSAVVQRGITANLDEVEAAMAQAPNPRQALRVALELWAVRDFDQSQGSPEAKEVLEASRDSARDVYEAGYRRLESLMETVLPDDRAVSAAELAHLVASSLRGFKLVAPNAHELGRLIAQLLDALAL